MQSVALLLLLASASTQAPMSGARDVQVQQGPGKWHVLRQPDPIRGGDSLAMVVESENGHDFAWPYQGGSKLRLWLARNAAGGEGAIIELTNGQLVCSPSIPCSALVRFDERPARRFRLGLMEDFSPNRLRIVDGEEFARELISAHRLVVEVTVFREGTPQFSFDVSGLDVASDQRP
ncbi:hypothetical protein MRBLMA1_001211 [Sphingobium sp. LMA1-1-1.1]|uniref:hypothetical protein n=1 Tax=Sphingobium sp. LMA1-1-1.1 TaxID=3135238 RepID=UPI0034167F10